MKQTDISIQRDAHKCLIEAREHLDKVIDMLGAKKKADLLALIEEHARFFEAHERFGLCINILVDRHNAELDKKRSGNV